MVLSAREADLSKEGFHYWPFVSLHSWGEKATGEDQTGVWKITVWDSVSGMPNERPTVLLGYPNSREIKYPKQVFLFLPI